MENFSERLRQLRKEKSLTQKQLASLIGMSNNSIVSYENNIRTPTGKALATLESFFNVSGAYLLGETDNRDAESRKVWEDSEIMLSVHKEFESLMNKLINNIKNASNEEAKMFFDILVELRSITSPKNGNRAVLLSSLQEIIFVLIQYISFCKYHSDDFDDILVDKKIMESLSKFRSVLIECKDSISPTSAS
jgi:transcriptional regulator with XRE-family HTH domain